MHLRDIRFYANSPIKETRGRLTLLIHGLSHPHTLRFLISHLLCFELRGIKGFHQQNGGAKDLHERQALDVPTDYNCI